MARASNILTTILNALMLLVGILFVAAAILTELNPGGATLCEKAFKKPHLFIGIFLIVLAVLGIIGACFRVNAMLYIYSTVLFLVILGLIAFNVFALVVTNKGIGEAISFRGFKEHQFGDYSRWLQQKVLNYKNWEQIKSCLIDSRICLAIAQAKKSEDFYRHKLTPLESGCCKPPVYCKFQFVNATYWVPPKSGPGAQDTDCTTWSNDQKQLCYDCKSCKVGVLANMRHLWRGFAVINFIVLIFVIIVYSISCCAIRNNQSKPKPYHY